MVERHSFKFLGYNLVAEIYLGFESEGSSEPSKGHQKRGTQRKAVYSVTKVSDESETESSDQDSSTEYSSSGESDVESCTIQITGVKRQTSEDTVKKFFSSRRKSGGGKIDDFSYNEATKTYTITYTERDGKILMKHLISGNPVTHIHLFNFSQCLMLAQHSIDGLAFSSWISFCQIYKLCTHLLDKI